MLITAELGLHGFLAFVLMPLVLKSIYSPIPRRGLVAKLHAADKTLVHAENTFVLTVCIGSALLLARHFDLVEADAGTLATTILNWAIGAAFLVFVAVLVRAAKRLRRGVASGS